MDVAQVKERQRAVWGLGDYRPLSRLLEPASRELCQACGVSGGKEVLDVAAGDGNFARACAREGARVVATDLSPRMVERGRARLREEGLDVEWLEADAEAIPFDDARFDCAGSVFGAMLAPRSGVVAKELFRVVRAGGVVGLTAWTVGSFCSELFAIGRRYVPPPPGMPRAEEEWGDEDAVRARLGPLSAATRLERRTLRWQARSAEALEATLGDSAPTVVAARQSLSPEQYDAMRLENLDLLRRWNTARDGTLAIESEYLLTVARKRG